MKKSETKKYIVVIDPKTTVCNGFCYKELTAKNVVDAMREAEQLIDETVYLIDIYEKQAGGDKEKVPYKHILRNRTHGWKTDELSSYNTLVFWYKYADTDKKRTSSDFDWIA